MTVAALYIDPRGPYPSMADACEHSSLPCVDCWDATRDARKYDGPHPVVAHPPCKHWGRLRRMALNEWVCNNPECPSPRESVTRENMADYKIGDWEPCIYCDGTCYVTSDRDCAPRAVEQVRAYGGVLEHPAGSLLWEACGLPAPQQHELVRTADTSDWEGPLFPRRDAHGGWCVELDQCEWGHVARKRTWLYLVGVPREALEAPPFPGREPTHWISGFRTSKGRSPERYAKNGSAVPPGIKVCSAQQRRRFPPPPRQSACTHVRVKALCPASAHGT